MASARTGRDVGVLLIDLDNFKMLNDTRGHGAGDLLLTQVARRLTSVVRDIDTVARLGGDEFVVVLGELSEDPMEAATQTRHIGEKLLASVNATFDLDGFTVATSASIGATLLAHRHIGGDELQREADIAMYQAKKAGRNALCFFDNDMQMAVLSRAGLELDITRALSEQQFTLYYQPQVHADGRVVGLEALLRWPHPERGMVSPVEFVPLAEETGQIIALGHWVMQTACRQLAAWRHHPQLAGVPIAVNVSAKQFALYHFVEDVQALLAQTGAAPDMLKLELTESLLLESYADVTARMRALKVEGIRFSIDDFGTGYSSLSYLKQLPLDQLKIDQSFVRDVLQDDQVAAIARTIIALADSLSLEVIAEGVETEAQRDFLRDAGCLRYQGYYFGRPMPAEAVEAYMAARCQAGAADMA
jgi:diguanylate cyclase (GGDEF)-like protein